MHAANCLFCNANLTFANNAWRDETEDPGDGNGGDATCGVRTVIHGSGLVHLPIVPDRTQNLQELVWEVRRAHERSTTDEGFLLRAFMRVFECDYGGGE